VPNPVGRYSPHVFEAPVQRLIDELARLPGIGQKSAQRLAFHVLHLEEEDARRLAGAIISMREQVRLCARCFNVTDSEQCSICRDLRRDPAEVCVVERAQDIVVIERTQEFRGRYHVLGGAISPIEGIGPEQLRMRELVARIDDEGIKEVIAATNPTVEGDTTALYLARLLKPLGVKVTRLASGLPVGGDLDYADEITLGRALAGRLEL
jgi:recombination protein RecR